MEGTRLKKGRRLSGSSCGGERTRGRRCCVLILFWAVRTGHHHVGFPGGQAPGSMLGRLATASEDVRTVARARTRTSVLGRVRAAQDSGGWHGESRGTERVQTGRTRCRGCQDEQALFAKSGR